MKLEHSFTVPADLNTVWQAVLDPERVAPCMPGATLTEVAGDNFKGSVKVKLGPISLLYKGSGEFLKKDESTRTVVIKASGKDTRGNGTAAATVTVTLTADGTATTGAVETDLSITGKPAQFGRGLISEVGGKILDTFATCLAAKLAPAETPDLTVVKEPAASTSAAATASAEAAVAASASPEAAAVAADHAEAKETGRKAGEVTAAHAPPKLAAAPEPETEPIDLLSYAGPSVLKRAAPLLALVAAVLVFIALRRRRGGFWVSSRGPGGGPGVRGRLVVHGAGRQGRFKVFAGLGREGRLRDGWLVLKDPIGAFNVLKGSFVTSVMS